MALLRQRFQERETTVSFEVFPAATPEAEARLLAAIKELCALKPDFISCTYGAGGGNREKTLNIVEYIQNTYGVTAMAHLTCVLNSRSEIEAILKECDRRGIENILALRGDPPKGSASGQDGLGDFKYSSELVAFIRSRLGYRISIGVAGFPEKHLLAPNMASDRQYLKQKIDAGAEFVITQLFFDNRLYFDYVRELKKIGVTAPVLPGILPVTDYGALKRFCERCGASIPEQIHKIFTPIANDPEKSVEAGIQYAVKQCRELLKGGAPGLHFYTLNKAHSTKRILELL